VNPNERFADLSQIVAAQRAAIEAEAAEKDKENTPPSGIKIRLRFT
jgi:hypothetical protein